MICMVREKEPRKYIRFSIVRIGFFKHTKLLHRIFENFAKISLFLVKKYLKLIKFTLKQIYRSSVHWTLNYCIKKGKKLKLTRLTWMHSLGLSKDTLVPIFCFQTFWDFSLFFLSKLLISYKFKIQFLDDVVYLHDSWIFNIRILRTMFICRYQCDFHDLHEHFNMLTNSYIANTYIHLMNH